MRDDTDGCVADYGAQGCNVKSVIPKIKHCKLKRLEMSESFEWHVFLESVEDLCRKVESWVQLSDSNTLQDFLFTLQARRINSTDAKG